MSNNVSKIVEKFLDSLEKKVLDLQLQVENLKAKNKEFDELEQVITELHTSKINFVVNYLNKNTRELAQVLEKAIEDKDKINYYLSEMTNYYYLYETNLLNNEVTLEQTKRSEQAINELEEELRKYQSSINVVKNRENIKELEQLEEKIVSFGAKFSYIEEKEETVELELFVELMEDSRLSEEEKIELLQLVIKNNTSAYEKQLMEKDTKIIETFEKKQEEALEVLDELEPDTVIARIDQETLQRIEIILSNPEIVKKLVKVVAEREDVEIDIDGTAFYEEDQELVEESLDIAKEAIIDLIDREKAQTPEEALDIFIESNDDDLRKAETQYEEIFGEEEKEDENTSIDEYLEMIQMGIEFYDHNKKTLKEITQQEKESIDNYSRGLYHNKGNRIIVYKSKTYNGNVRTIIKEATYEIKTLLTMIEKIETADKLTNEIIIKTGRRIGEILESVEELSKDNIEELQTEQLEEKSKKGTVYFLEKGTDNERTVYEEEIGVGNYNKGISNSYYKDLLFQLEQIENRSQRRIPSIRPNNSKTYPYTSNFGVRIISSNRTSTYYIPVGKEDAIIVGVRFIDTGDGYPKTLEQRLKTHAVRLDELIEKVSAGDAKKDAQKYLQEIKQILSNDSKVKEETDNIEELFAVQPVEIIKPKHM